MSEKKFEVLPLYMDLQAKNLFGTERNILFTENLLENYFNLEKGTLRGCKIINSIVLTSEKIKGKKIEMDIKVELPSGKEVNLEFYSYYDESSEIKSFIYISKLFGNQLKRGEDYNLIHKVNQIKFVYEDKIRKDEIPVKRYLVVNKDNPNDFILGNMFEIDIVNLAIKRNLDYNGYNEGFEVWRKLMGANTYEEMKNAVKGKTILEEALKEMERFSNNEEVQDYFTKERLQRSQMNTAKKEGLKEGIEEGIKQSQIEIAKNMLQEKCDIDLITKVTGLSKKTIEELKKA